MTSRPTIRTLGDLIATLPHQLGYTPHESLVLILFRDVPGRVSKRTGALGPVMRVDLLPPDVWQLAVAQIEPVLARERPDFAFLVAFESTEDSTGMLQAVRACCRRNRVPVEASARVRDGRWALVEGRNRTGTWAPVPPPHEVAAVADLVLAGRAPGRSREALRALIESGHPEQQRAVAARLAERSRQRGCGRAALRGDEPVWRAGARAIARLVDAANASDRAVARVEPLTVDEVCDVVESLEDREFRDAVLAWLCPGHLSGGLLDRRISRVLCSTLPLVAVSPDEGLLDQLLDLAVRVPPQRSAGVMTSLAQVAWWQGNGMLGNLAVDRALSVDPRYRLADLLARLLAACVRPPRPQFAGDVALRGGGRDV